MGAATLAGAAASAVWLAAVAAYAAGYFASPAPGATAGPALMLLVAAVALVGALAALATALSRRDPPAAAAARDPGSRDPGRRDLDHDPSRGLSPEAARLATEVARAASAETARALSGRIAALEAALAETRSGVAALSRAAGVGPAGVAAPPAKGGRAEPVASHTAPPSPRRADEPALPFADAPAASVAWADVVRALDFPRSDADAEGFRALRAALADPQLATLLQAAEDVLNILATHGLHMEDLSPDPPDRDAWAAYAGGARGAAADGVGAVRDPGALAAAQALLRRDPVFRDAAMVFARRWGVLVGRIHAEGAGSAMAGAADTRSGRAFMLLARALGAFD